jgi:N-acetylmuramoyl-L-alanine amidase
VQAIHPGDQPTTIAFDLGPRFASFRAADQPVPGGATRIVIDLVTATETAPTPGTPPPTPPAGETPPLLDLPPAGGLRTIVIDPGHGGDENGARGEKGTLEKTVTLSVARRLKGALEGRLGVRVLLTRDGDQTVPLDQRAAVANNNKADLFISLHVNASLRKVASGAQIFYLSLDRADEEARRVAESEGVAMPVFGGGTREIDVILWEMAQARHIDQSAVLARAVEQQMRAALPMGPQAIQQAPFRVLVGANMPAVLVEVGYLTNAEQEDQLRSGEFQGRVVQAIAEGIARFDARARGPMVPPLPGVLPR